jgi:hypothetical protein
MTNVKNLRAVARRWVSILALLMGASCAGGAVLAQGSQCRDDITAAAGFKVRSVKIEARGGWAPQVALPFAPGDTYDPARRSAAHTAVRDALKGARGQGDFELAARGAFSVLFVDSCVRVVEEAACSAAQGTSRCVDVVIRPISLRLDLYEVGSNILPIPRSNRPTFYEQVPAPLRLLNPTFGGSYDRRDGPALSAGFAGNLFELLGDKEDATAHASSAASPHAPPIPSRRTHLDLEGRGKRSLTEPFYDTEARLTLSRRRAGRFVESIGAAVGFDADSEPRGEEGRRYENAARLTFNLKLRPRFGVLNSIGLNAGYRRSNNRFFDDRTGAIERVSEDAFEARAVVDGRLANGFARLGLWFDHGAPDGEAEAYRRLVGLVGYQREFALAPNQTIGVEVMFGMGRGWGALPEYARFYGGNRLSNFLYESIDAPSLLSLPPGPLLRSFGVGQAAVKHSSAAARGGTSFWHFNSNLTLPIPAWSRPLIPAEKVFDDEEITLKGILKAQVNTSENFLAQSLKSQQPELTEAEARARAREIINEIRPAVFFIADEANLYALKPLLMFDAARIGADGVDDRVRFGLGGGLQLTVVVAKFEVGYMRTIRRLPNDPQGNVVMRLAFQNLF